MKRKKLHRAILAASLAATAFGVAVGADQPAGDNTTQAATSVEARNPRSDHWSYQPIRKPAVPATAAQHWVRTPIDAFVLKSIEEKGLTPSQDADRETLARRLSLDLLGFIPDPQLVAGFVNDESPDAYEKLVDTLLASPHYGERQARKWLDLARYADSSGFQNDSNRLNMWRYRDYVVESFNEDKPYDRFVQEQLAGDELWPGNEEALIATGFMAQYTDNSNSRDMVQRHYQIVTDITDTVGEVILGQTVECARCHDHKFDAISQKEYFSLQSFFSNVSAVDNIPVRNPQPTDLAYTNADNAYKGATRDINAKIGEIVNVERDAAVTYQKERYLTDTREAIFKPEAEWTALDRWINHRLANVAGNSVNTAVNYFEERGKSVDPEFHSDWHAEKLVEIEALQEQLKQFDVLKPTLEMGSNTISAMTELGYSDAPATYQLFGGDHERPLEEVFPAFPAAINGATPQIPELDFSSGRRTALVQWLTSPENPLTARVYVNRIWDQYFGRGIVETVSDFGKAGTKPSNPELLDYLASRFIESGWSVKALHREIVLSSVYRQESIERPEVLEADPENRSLAVFPRHRLEAEQIRDSLLVASGKLNAQIGGPSVLPPLPVSARDGGGEYGNQWKASKDVEAHNRRSLYIFTRRSLPYPLLDAFNMASPQEAHSKRDVTTTPLQALTLINSEIVYDWSRALAGRVINDVGYDERAQIEQLYHILFARSPRKEEVGALQTFLDQQEKIIEERSQNGAQAIPLPTDLASGPLNQFRAAAFVDLVHTVANSNEAIYRF